MGFKARRIKFKVFDRLNKDCHIVGENHHDYMSCGKFEDLEVFYYNYQTGEGSITYDEELPADGSGYILMQYTGFNTRKDNIELYEYDIIRYGDAVGFIQFKDGMWFIRWDCEHDDLRNDLFYWATKTDISYTGNCFLNPEMGKFFVTKHFCTAHNCPHNITGYHCELEKCVMHK